jgi:hypothetical protein
VIFTNRSQFAFGFLCSPKRGVKIANMWKVLYLNPIQSTQTSFRRTPHSSHANSGTFKPAIRGFATSSSSTPRQWRKSSSPPSRSAAPDV